jgi:hypothetical protein
VGRIEPRLDRKGRVVRILGLSWEPAFDPLEAPGFESAFAAVLDNYAGFGGADSVIAPTGVSHQALFRSLAGQIRVRRAVQTRATSRRAAPAIRSKKLKAALA